MIAAKVQWPMRIKEKFGNWDRDAFGPDEISFASAPRRRPAKLASDVSRNICRAVDANTFLPMSGVFRREAGRAGTSANGRPSQCNDDLPWILVQTYRPRPVAPERPEDILNAFDREFTHHTKLVLCSHIITGTGLITPIKALARLAHDRGALIVADGAHAPGMIPLDLLDLGCDFYGGNCHKWLCAPKGTGFALYFEPFGHKSSTQYTFHSWGSSRDQAHRKRSRRLLRHKSNCGISMASRHIMWGTENWGTRDQACFAASAA